MKHDDAILRLLELAYLSGFRASGEGWNGEYPFEQKRIEPETDADWLKYRKSDLQELLETVK